MTGKLGVAAVALLASLGLASKANAQLLLSYETTTSGHAIGEAFTGGEFVIKYFNFDMGTVYSPLGAPGTAAGFGQNGTGTQTVAGGTATLNGLPRAEATGDNPNGGEDSWGIAKVEGIFDSSGGRIWSQDVKGQELTVMFYGAQDFYVQQVENGYQEINSAGLHVDLYLQSVGGPGYTAYNPLLGSGGRTGTNSYTTVTDGTMILSTVSTAGFMFNNGTFGGQATEFRTNFNAGSGGLGEAYLNVTGGSMASVFNTNSVTSPVSLANNPALRADLFAQFTTDLTSVSDWLVSSQDPVRGNLITAVPEPSTYGLIAAGALAGIVALRRMKKRAQAVTS
ncbi:MAG TPA: PEP-CTERM sorting domain-containing protein [Opitutaceae bacterium]|nr:PEP-CTERM sorting domain-containing protein [Opitutaceae bacterium]